MKEYECTHFVDSIVYLMKQTSEYCRAKAAQYFEDINVGVSLDQFFAVDTISFNEGICQRDLSKLILKDRSYTSRLLNSLEDESFIERRIETKGKRLVKKLYVTNKGKMLVVEYQDRLKSMFLEIFKDISDEEFATTRATLEKMKSCVSKYTIMPL